MKIMAKRQLEAEKWRGGENRWQSAAKTSY